MQRRGWLGSLNSVTTIGVAGVLAATFMLATPVASADVCADAVVRVPLPVDTGVCADVLRQEARWLKAIPDGDRATIEAILGPEYRHTTSAGRQLDRAQELAGTAAKQFSMNPSEQEVVLAGDTAVVHGVNTVICDDGTVLARERFTDVFVLQNGQWIALSAQETEVDQ